MAIKRYTSNKDNTITNAFESNLTSRGTGSNMGASDILEVFSIYGQALQPESDQGSGSGETAELSRVLIQFPINDISTDRDNETIPVSGSVDFYLRLYNARHGQTTPRDITFVIAPVSKTWEEGFGLDMDEYKDITRDREGSNWMKSAGDTSWTTPGGDYLTASVITKTLEKGTEDLEVNITEIVEEWISSDGYSNYGIGVQLTGSQEAYFSSSTGDTTGSVLHNLDGAQRSYYTKKFFGRGSEFFFKRPTVEARWDSSKKDQRGNSFYSSSLASATENINTLYFYNYFRGQLRNIPGIDSGGSPVYVEIYHTDDGTPTGSAITLVQSDYVTSTNQTVVTGGYVSTGIYSASFALTGGTSPDSLLHDVWISGSATGVTLHTGSFKPKSLKSSNYKPYPEYVTTITNLKSKYHTSENPTFRLFIREKNWCPSVYTKAVAAPDSETIEDAYYKVFRIIDNLEIINYGTGSSTSPQTDGAAGSYTRASYDVSGSYFDLDMSTMEPGYMYGVRLAYYINGSYVEQSETFKFRVEELEEQ